MSLWAAQNLPRLSPRLTKPCADAVHVATAAVHDECHTLYSGDPDFEGITEVDTVVL